MKKILLSACMLLGVAASAQIISIQDANLKNKLLSANTSNFVAIGTGNQSIILDVNADGEIDQSEADLVYYLNVNNAGVVSLSGLEDFTNLKSLQVRGNNIVSVNLSGFTNLEYFDCMESNIHSLSVSGLNALGSIYCDDNPLSYLDLHDLPAIREVYCSNTLLTELNLSQIPSLEWFRVNDNPLLTKINIHNGSILPHPMECDLSNLPSLLMLCIDEDEDDVMLPYFESNQILPPYMSTTCEYVPGQVYNAISGKIRLDLNGNGCTDADTSPGYYPVKISDGTNEKIKYTNQNGEYIAFVKAGTYTIEAPYNGILFASIPATASVTFASIDNESFVQDFCIAPNGVVDDVTVTLSAGFSMPGFDTYCHVYIRNNGNTVTNGTVTFNYDDNVLDYVLTTPQAPTVAPGTVTWGYSNLKPFESRSYTIKLNVNSPTETPAVNIDDILTFDAVIGVQGNDVNPADNTYEAQSLVVGSLDPNNIICMEGDKEPVENIGKYLNYEINFENTGNAAATFVVVTQEIDDTKFDVNSFEVINSSHAVDVTRTGNLVTFMFDDINLGAAAQGTIVFRVKTLASLEEGDQVMNRANIVFDYNYALVTNEAVTTFETILGINNPVIDQSIKVYPNPSADVVNVQSQNEINIIELYDLQGRLLQINQINTVSAQLDLTGRQSGIYFVKITTDKGSKVEKLIKE